MDQPTIYRRRFIPNEMVLLKDDKIISLDEETLVTSWDVLRPRKDFVRGTSCYFLKKGYKVSKFLNGEGELVYYYCDIIDTYYDKDKNAFTFVDLLADVIIYENGFVKVVDIGEITEALDMGLISIALVKKALNRLDSLLNLIYAGKFQDLVKEYLE